MGQETESKRAEMKRAVQYRSGPGMINVVYLGGMTASAMLRLLGENKCKENLTLDEAIDRATPEQIDAAWNYEGFQWILKHYRNAGSRLYKYRVVREEV